ncbi:cellulose-complementing protein-like [Armigeres subalbatus]|uniref:cellulose-complementing protein-like n=1 Tax=Armigeres subalbatus TaxID=124917 RepID=UPI002ED4586D
MVIHRIRFKMFPWLLPLMMAILAVNGHHHHHNHHRQARADPELISELGVRKDGENAIPVQEASFSECTEPHCSKLKEWTFRAKRSEDKDDDDEDESEAEDEPGELSAAGSEPKPAVLPADTDLKDMPLPPPVQVFPNMPENFPYPTLDVIQHPPVPTRSRKRPGFKSPYPVPSAPMPPLEEQTTPQNPIPAESTPRAVDDAIQLPQEPAAVVDLSDFNVPGTTDGVVENAPPLAEAPVVETTQMPQAPQVPQTTAADDNADVGHRTMIPEDWRYSVQPKRRCKTTPRQPCRPGVGQSMPPAGFGSPGAPAMPGQTPGGEDAWKIAEQAAMAELKQRDDPPPAPGAPAASSAARDGFAVVALVLANALYCLI